MDAKKMPDTDNAVWELFQTLSGMYECHAVIERVSSSPQMGVKSAFTFGYGFGGLNMALIAAGISAIDARPQDWLKMYRMKKRPSEPDTKWKNRLKAKAQTLHPSLTITKATSDAVLIAEYCYKEFRYV